MWTFQSKVVIPQFRVLPGDVLSLTDDPNDPDALVVTAAYTWRELPPLADYLEHLEPYGKTARSFQLEVVRAKVLQLPPLRLVR